MSNRGHETGTISLKRVVKTFPSSTIGPIDLNVSNGEICVVVGPSGAGKTTLLRLVSQSIQPDSGAVEVSGGVSPAFQDYGLFPWMTAQQNVAFSLRLSGHERQHAVSLALETLGELGLQRHADKWPVQLSGGMRQRVGLARVLSSDSSIAILDEPFSALDEIIRYRLQQEFRSRFKAAQKTVLWVTHSVEEALQVGDRVVLLGGTPRQISQEWKIPDSDALRGNYRDSNELEETHRAIRAALARDHELFDGTGAGGTGVHKH